MYLTNARHKTRLWIGIAGLILLNCAAPERAVEIPENDTETRIIKQADLYLNEGQYDKCHLLLSRFLEKFPESNLRDDAAYRLAYLMVGADSANPYFNYTAAQRAFTRFAEAYPHSRYIYACNNWLKILNLYLALKNMPVQENSNRTQEIQAEISRLRDENTVLRKTLSELEHALQR